MRFLLALGFVVALAAPVLAEPEPEHLGATPPREHEILSERPSGFWTSNRPTAKGEEYKWRLLAIGVGVAALTGFFTVRLIRNSKAPARAYALNSSRQTKP